MNQMLPQRAYQQAQNVTETARQTEYRLFAQVTRALMEAESKDYGAMVRALNWNRRLWLTLQADCASDDNRLPESLRAGIISLSIWVDRHSRLVLKKQAAVGPLVAVNRNIMEGLAQTP
jgi:flagellar protein FlaF